MVFIYLGFCFYLGNSDFFKIFKVREVRLLLIYRLKRYMFILKWLKINVKLIDILK